MFKMCLNLGPNMHHIAYRLGNLIKQEGQECPKPLAGVIWSGTVSSHQDPNKGNKENHSFRKTGHITHSKHE